MSQFKPHTTVPNTLRYRTRRKYPIRGLCEACKSAPAAERHHKDKQLANNHYSNIAFLCRPCHLAAHAAMRLPCSECGRDFKPLRKGLCNPCYQRKRKRHATHQAI